MKKIKFLLFGIVSILGVGLSFAEDFPTFYGQVPENRREMISFSETSGNYYVGNFGDNCIIGYYSNGDKKVMLSDGTLTGVAYSLMCGDGLLFTDSWIMGYIYTGAFFYNTDLNFVSTRYSYGYLSNRGTGDQYWDLAGNSYGYLTGTDSTTCIGGFVNSNNSNVVFYSDSSFENELGNAFPWYLACGKIYYKFNSSSDGVVYAPLLYGSSFHNGSNQGGDSSSPFNPVLTGGVFDFNTFLIEKSILCYMSSGSFGGDYGNCDGINYSGFVNQYDHLSPIWSGSSIEDYKGNIVFYNAESVLSNYCINTDSIQYQFCSQLNVYSGADLMYFYENGKLDYYVLGSGFGVDLGILGSGQLGELTCIGAWCDNISQGLPEYIRPISSGDNSLITGEILDQSFFLDFIDNHSFFSCPYPYSGSYFVLGKDLINRLGGRDLMIPINCFIAGFSAGQKVFFFGDPNQGKYWTGSLINGNTLSHQRLYIFFDLILSMGILLVGLKLFSHVTGRK